MTAKKQPKPDPRPHRDAFYEVNKAALWQLSGDVVLVPDPDNLAGLTRDALTKISHWSDMTDEDIPRLGIITDSFFRFIEEGQDATVLTLWRGGTPIVQQIDGEPCEAAVDLVMDAITAMKPLQEKWHGLPPLEAEIEILAYSKGFVAGHRPKWLERTARANLAERDIDVEQSEPAPVATNDNAQHDERLVPYLAAFTGPDAFISGNTVFGAVVGGLTGKIQILADGRALFTSRLSKKFVELPVQPKSLAASPFTLGDPASLPERDWLFGRHYIRRYATASVGPGGGGKTAHSISESLAMVTGRPLLDPQGALTKPLKVWWVNAEDPQDEINRRFHAAAKHFAVSNEQIGGRLFTDSGRDQEFVIARQEGRDLKIVEPFITNMVAEIRRREIDVVIVDPFVSTHEAQENDNSAMQRVAAAWVRVADEANCGIELVHHVAKNQGEVTADSARGGGAFKDKVRSMRVFNVMTPAEAEKAGVDDPRAYFRVDFGKVNMVASGQSQWRRFVSVPLGNGRGLAKTGDEIGVVEPWRWPSREAIEERAASARAAVVADVPAENLAGVKVRLEASDYKADQRAKHWAGNLLIETGIADGREQAKAMLAAWIDAGELEIVRMKDASRHEADFIKPIAGV
ncbi:AAA family ATPase [Rhizobium sp. WYCCWR 11152]|uniref:AAA family ATPase n=1 Tax=Rhizobium sp. WYCCWR 11152 TaxID=2692316 RepID=UPI001492D016|nr:AAA family ATPase [Rhizobium sp. WYCCWR 11152]NNU67605.1 AAA family ATPase [Rhizobium sp. WYCCWR 11152]